MDSSTQELFNYLAKNKSLINQLANERIWIYKFAILIQVFAFWLIINNYKYEENLSIEIFIMVLIGGSFKYFEGLFKKAFADKYELRKYKRPLDYFNYKPKAYSTIKRFRKFLGNRHFIIIIGGLALYVILFWRDRGTQAGFTNLDYYCGFLFAASSIDHYINIIKEISVSRKFKKLLVSGLDEYSVALEIINQERFNKYNEYTSYDEYEKLVEEYDQNSSPAKKAEDFMKPIVPKRNDIKDE